MLFWGSGDMVVHLCNCSLLRWWSPCALSPLHPFTLVPYILSLFCPCTLLHFHPCVMVIHGYENSSKLGLCAPTNWPHLPLLSTVRVCVWVSVSDRIVVNVSLDNSGLGWLMLCQEWRVPQTKSVQQSVFISYSVHFKHSNSSFYNVHDWPSPSALVLTPWTQIHCQVTGFL